MVPVVIFNGESNSGGYAPNTSATPAELAPRPAVQIFDNIGLASYSALDIGTNNLLDHAGLDPYTTHGWELALANSVEAGQWWDSTVYLIKTGQGGSKIADWGPTGTYYLKFLDRVRGGLGLLRAQGKVPVIYLWYTLGINDAIAHTNEAQWLLDVKAYHARVRGEIGYVPIFYCQAMAVSVGAGYNDSILQYDADDNMVFSIDATGASVRTDNNHWDYAGMKVMGGRLVAASTAFGEHENYLLKQTAMLAGGVSAAPPVNLPTLVRTPASVSFVEGSAGATFTVALSQAPTANVVVTVAAAGGNVTAAPATLTFTTPSWATPQTVTVTSPDDSAQNGPRTSTVTLSSPGVATSATVGVTVTDAFVAAGPANTALPAITGNTTLAAVLTCSTGTWTGSPTGYAYQWKRDTLDVAGETAATHTIVAADQGHTLVCTVTATNAAGSNSAASAGLAIPAKPVNTIAPAVTGSVAVGGVLTCSSGTWTGSPTYAYQWRRDGADVAGQTTSAYTVVVGDQGHSLACAVTATNAQGSTTVVSAGVVVSGLVAYSWQQFSNSSEDASHWVVCTSSASPAGANVIGSVDCTKPFLLTVDLASPATLSSAAVFILDDVPTTDFVWGAAQTFVTSCFQSGGFYSSVNGASNTPWGWTPTFPVTIKIQKSGNDVTYSSSTDSGVTFTLRFTHVGVLSGKTVLYPRVIFATAGAGRKMLVSHDISLE